MSKVVISWAALMTQMNFDMAMFRYDLDAWKERLEAMDETRYIVKSGIGYLVGFNGDSPIMTTDPVCASRLREDDAWDSAIKLDSLGFEAKLIKLKFAKIDGHAGGRWE